MTNKTLGIYWQNVNEDDDDKPITENMYLKELRNLLIGDLVLGKESKDEVYSLFMDGAKDWLKTSIEEEQELVRNISSLDNEKLFDDRERAGDVKAFIGEALGYK